MREMTITTPDGKDLTLVASFGASVKIADKVSDPLMIAREAALEAAMMRAKMPYRPKFEFTVKNVPVILHIGLAAGGSDMTIEDVQDLVFDIGFVHARITAADYIALLVEPKPTNPQVEPEDDLPEDMTPGNGKGSKAGAAA